MNNDLGDELLEYQTEADAGEIADELAAAVPPNPLPVCVYEPVVTVPTASQHATCYTLVVDSDDARYVELLPEDPLRTRALVIVNDGPVVICNSRAQANSATNQASGVPDPTGAYIPAGPTASTQIEILATNQFFVAATSANPARVTVIAERRTA